jgi:hypothetical protein
MRAQLSSSNFFKSKQKKSREILKTEISAKTRKNHVKTRFVAGKKFSITFTCVLLPPRRPNLLYYTRRSYRKPNFSNFSNNRSPFLDKTRLKLHSVLTRVNPRLLSTYKTDRSNRKQNKTAGLRPERTMVGQDWDTTAVLWSDKTGT